MSRAIVGGLWLPQALIGACTAYLGVLTVAAWRAIGRGVHLTATRSEPTLRFVILVPAHNEEQLIGQTLDSLADLDYPTDLYVVHVVADHCTDRTATVARERGVEVHEHDDPEPRGKGPGLNWVITRLHERGEPHDAVVVVDADTLVRPNFLRVADARLANGAQAIQAYYAVRAPEGSSTAALRSAALAVRHYLRPLGRTSLGGSSGLYGNGMVFDADVVRRYGWSDHLTEDNELQLTLLLDGIHVDFAADAVVEAEMPSTLEASRSQNERWERGRLDLAQRFVPELGRRLRDPGRGAYLDAAFDQLVPPYSVLVASSLLTAASSLVTPRHGFAGRLSRWVAGGTLGIQVLCVLSGLRMISAPRATYKSLVGAPLLIVWKLGLWLRVLVRPGHVAWVRTRRNMERQ